MDKYYFYYFICIANVLLFLFAATVESTLLKKRKRTEIASTSASSSSVAVVSKKKQVNKCFADFLVLQVGEKTKMFGINKNLFMVDPLFANRERFHEFMQRNGEEKAKLWNCVNNARPFPHNDGLKGNIGDKMLEDLIDIFRMKIARHGLIAPSKRVQQKLQKAQCLLDLGVIEGKILLEEPNDLANYDYEAMEQSEWYKELMVVEKNQAIVISKQGADHMQECLTGKGKPFDVRITESGPNEHHLFLGSVDQEELLKMVYKQVPLSARLLKKTGLNKKQKQCYADFFVSYLGELTEMRGQQFVVEKSEFPPFDTFISVMTSEDTKGSPKKTIFENCLKKSSTLPNHLRTVKQMENLARQFFKSNFSEPIVLSQEMQHEMQNAQCWLDLGLLEYKIGSHNQEQLEVLWRRYEILPLLKKLESEQPILVSSEGATFMERCLHKGAPFEAKTEKIIAGENQWHVQLLKSSERIGLLVRITQTPLYKWLHIEISTGGSTTLSNNGKEATATSSSSPARGIFSSMSFVWNMTPKNIKLVEECFADFLVLQIEAKMTMRGKNKSIFMVLLHIVSLETLHEFMKGNARETSKLWNCVNHARPFPNDGVKENSDEKRMADLIDIFRMKISRHALIAPSKRVQEKLHNAQCLLDLGAIEGKILMEETNDSGDYEPMEEQPWFKEFKAAGNNQQIVISKEGVDHLKKCLRRGKPFYVNFGNGPGPNLHHFVLGSVNREELMRLVFSQLPYSEGLLKKIELNQKQKQCFADLFVSRFDVETEMHGQQFVVKEGVFPDSDLIEIFLQNADTEEKRKKKETFVECVNGASPFPRFFRNQKQLANLVKEFYNFNFSEPIALSQQIQQEMHNAQCWLELGPLEGKIQMQHAKAMENDWPRVKSLPWRKELLESESEQPIVVSSEGATFMERCLRKGAPFEAKLEKKAAGENQWHLQLKNAAKRTEFFKRMQEIDFSEWLYREISHEQNCVFNFLVKHWHAQTMVEHLYSRHAHTYTRSPVKLWRNIVWYEEEDDHQQQQQQNSRKWPSKFYAKDKGFEKLKSCLFRKGVFLKRDPPLLGGEQYIDLEPLFELMGDEIYATPELTKELNIQSDCLANFLAYKTHRSGPESKCLLRKKKGPTGKLLDNSAEVLPFSAYIIGSVNGYGNYALSAENCHLPEGEAGIYRKYSEDGKESEDFKQLWDCGFRMTTSEDKAIDVRELLKIHTPAQLYLRGDIMELFFTPVVPATLDEDDVCSLCLMKFGQNDLNIVASPCNHNFHNNCVQDWVRKKDNCPICRQSITNALQDPNEVISTTEDEEMTSSSEDVEMDGADDNADDAEDEEHDDEQQQQQQ